MWVFALCRRLVGHVVDAVSRVQNPVGHNADPLLGLIAGAVADGLCGGWQIIGRLWDRHSETNQKEIILDWFTNYMAILNKYLF